MNHLTRFAVSTACLACACLPGNASAQASVQDSLVNTLDDLLYTAESLQMPLEVQAHILVTREQIQQADPIGFETLPDTMRNPLQLMELGSAQMRLNFEMQQRAPMQRKPFKNELSTESAGADYDDGVLDEPGYPDIPWDFAFTDPGEPEDEGDHGGSGSDSGFCTAPGYSVGSRFDAANAALILEAIKDIAEQGCNQSGLGFNASLACIVTDIAAFIAIGVNVNQELCNDSMTAAEVTATWEGLVTVHGNVQHVHDDLVDLDADVADVDADLAVHDSDIKSALSQHDADIKALLNEVLANQGVMLSNQATIIQLLQTPSGRRPGWND